MKNKTETIRECIDNLTETLYCVMDDALAAHEAGDRDGAISALDRAKGIKESIECLKAAAPVPIFD